MRTSLFSVILILFVSLACAQQGTEVTGYSDTPILPGQKWRVHDKDRPKPRMVTPGATIGAPPSDAIVLFDGKDTSKWQTPGKPLKWVADKGTLYAPANGAGTIETIEKFGDIQLHIEFATPTEIQGYGQNRGNSGVLLMSRYEIQVLDSWDNPTYADGQAGAIYGQWPPLVNAAKKPGEWQTYDIFFEAPKFEGDKLVKPGYATVVHNGILVQHHKEIIGRMAHKVVGTYAPHGPEEPLALQDHNTRTRFRNIWVRRITPYDQGQ